MLTHHAVIRALLAFFTCQFLVPCSVFARQDTQFERLVLELGADKYLTRQTASEKLWQMGPQILSQLEELRGKTSDVEINSRLDLLLAVFRLELDSSTPRALAKNVLLFSEHEYIVQREVLSNLVRLRRYDLILRLIELLPMARRERMFVKYIQLKNRLPQLIRAEKTEELDELLTHPLTKRFYSSTYLFWQDLNGRMSEELAIQKATVDTLIATLARLKTENPTAVEKNIDSEIDKSKDSVEVSQIKKAEAELQIELRILLQSLRMLNKNSMALSYARHISDDKKRSIFHNHLLMEMGDWKRVSNNLVDPDRKPDFKKNQINATLPRQIAASHFAGDRANVERCLKKLSRQYKNLSQNETANANKLRELEAVLARCHLFLHDWDSALTWIEKSRFANRVELYIAVQRNKELLDLFRYGNEADQRLQWSQKIVARLRALARQFKRTEIDRIQSRQTHLFRQVLQFLRQLDRLGFHDEAAFHFQVLAEHYGSSEFFNISNLYFIISHLIKLGHTTEADEIVRAYFRPSQYYGLSTYLFPNRREVANPIWYSICNSPGTLDHKLRSARRLFQTSCHLEPLSNDETQQRLAQVRPASNAQNSLTHQVQIYLACYQGDFQKLQELIDQVVQRGTNQSREFAIQLANAKQDFETVINLAKQQKVNSEYIESLIVQAHNRNGQFEKAKLLHLNLFLDFSSSHNNRGRITSYQQNGKMVFLERIANTLIHSTQKNNSWLNEAMREFFAESVVTTNPTLSRNSFRMELFSRINDSNSLPNASYLAQLKRLSQMEIIADWKSVSAQRRKDLRERHLNFFGPDTELVKMLVATQENQEDPQDKKDIDDWISAESKIYFHWLNEFPASPLLNNNYAWMLVNSPLAGPDSQERKTKLNFAREHALLANNAAENASFLDTLAFIEFKSGRLKQARDLQRQTIRLQPNRFAFWQRYFRYGGTLDSARQTPIK